MAFAAGMALVGTAAAGWSREPFDGLAASSAALPVLPGQAALTPPQRPVSLFVATLKTVARRTGDAFEADAGTAPGATLVDYARLRAAEDAFFVNRARHQASRVDTAAALPVLARAETGAEFLDRLAAASRDGPIGRIVVYGHSGPDGLYMREDRGFYVDLDNTAANSSVVTGSIDGRVRALRERGARDLGDLAALIERGAVRFAPDAVIFFTGCSTAGEFTLQGSSMAIRIAMLTGAEVVGSVGSTDQSMAKLRGVRGNREFSRRKWVHVVGARFAEELRGQSLDPLGQKYDAGASHPKAPAARPDVFGSDRMLKCAAAAPGHPRFGSCAASDPPVG